MTSVVLTKLISTVPIVPPCWYCRRRVTIKIMMTAAASTDLCQAVLQWRARRAILPAQPSGAHYLRLLSE